ncbi:DUF1403 family protein [Mesorhizobium sp. M1300]
MLTRPGDEVGPAGRMLLTGVNWQPIPLRIF